MRVLIVASMWLILASGVSQACTYSRGPFLKTLDIWTATCGHPLCGKIVAADPQRVKKSPTPCDAETWLTLKDEVTETVVGGGVVLVGDIHDNAKHQELRAVMGMANFLGIVMEQISTDQDPAVQTFLSKFDGNGNEAGVNAFKTAIGWDASGWARYNYDPLLRAILFSRRALIAGVPPADKVKTVAKEGEGVVPADERARLKLDVPLGDKLDTAVLAELEESHCGALPKEALPNMAFAQRYRDATLADAALESVRKHGAAIVFAGNGHVRTDRGVPWYLHQRAPDKKTLSIMLIEVEDGKTDADAYYPRDPDGKPAVDYVVFTPKATRGDPCEGMTPKKVD